jgi:hypothetical protein
VWQDTATVAGKVEIGFHIVVAAGKPAVKK